MNFLIGFADLKTLAEWIIRILLSIFCGICIGLERKNRQQIIGIRTLLLISSSSTLLGILSEYSSYSTLANLGDPSRISAAVITGIGFVGGGAIMQRGLNVKGVTTAALIWTTSAIGLAIGDGLYLPAFLTFVFVLIFLPVFQKFESKHFATGKIKTLKLVFEDTNIDYQSVSKIFEQNKILINDVNYKIDNKENITEITFFIYSPRHFDFSKLNDKFKQLGNLLNFSFGEQ